MMLGLGGCPRLCALHSSTSSIQYYPTCQPLPHFLSASSASFVTSVRRLREPQLGFRAVLGRERIGFSISAGKRRKGVDTLLEDDWFGDDGDEGDEEDEFLAFPNMKKWLQDKPSGFGEGKVYETRIEDKLLAEIEQSRVAQLANINELKRNPVTPNSKKANNTKQKATETVANAFRVRVVNLPKKKNIHRDLLLAFKEVPGIVNIIPEVSGNKKTRDPVCKGFAFVDLKTEDDANRFVHMFSKRSLAFGKIQKQIKFEVIKSASPNVTYKKSLDSTNMDPQSRVPSFDESPTSDFDIDNLSSDVWEENVSKISDGLDDLEGDIASDIDMDITSLDTWNETSDESNAIANEQKITAELEDVRENLESLGVSEMDSDYRLEPSTESGSDSLSSRQVEEIQALEKKPICKQGDKALKSTVQESELDSGDIIDQRVGGAADSSSSKTLENIHALERKLLARGKEWRVSNSDFHATKQDFDDSMGHRQQSMVDLSASKPLESIQELERRLLARGKWRTNPNSNTSISEVNGDDSIEKQQKKKQKQEKKVVAHKKRLKAPVLNLPGSMKRLKIKEKAVLTDVFSKYGANASNTTKAAGPNSVGEQIQL